MDFLALAATALKSLWLLGLGAAFLYIWRKSGPSSSTRGKARPAATNSARDVAAQQPDGVLGSAIAAASGDATKVAAPAKAGLSEAIKAAQTEAAGTRTVDQVRVLPAHGEMLPQASHAVHIERQDGICNARVTQRPRAATGIPVEGTVSTSVPWLMHTLCPPSPHISLRLNPAMPLNSVLWFL